MKQMQQILKESNIEYSIIIEDVGKLINDQNQKSKTYRGYNGKINFNEYYSHADVSKFSFKNLQGGRNRWSFEA